MAVDLLAPPDREKTASRLLRSSEKLSYDPTTDVDWDHPWEEGRYFTSPESSTLYGTELWDRMTLQQQIDLTRHEVASVASTGIWFEAILSRLLLRNVQWAQDNTTEHARYGMTEVGDEMRHNVMFSRLLEYLDAPYYRPNGIRLVVGELFTSLLADEATAFAGTLYVEEVLDQLQRRGMNDDRVQSVCQKVNLIHVTEEARHMTYAREEMARQWKDVGLGRKEFDRLLLALVAMQSTDMIIQPAVYANVGLDVGEAMKARRDNEHWAETRRLISEGLYDTFDEIGMTSFASRAVWRLAHLARL